MNLIKDAKQKEKLKFKKILRSYLKEENFSKIKNQLNKFNNLHNGRKKLEH